MSSLLSGKPLVAAVGVGALVAAFLAWRAWQGPEVPGYRTEARALVQQVVATGRVIATSRAAVGSEITAVVVERRVSEGDRVEPGDLLVVLKADDLAARVREAEAALRDLRESRRPQAAAALRQAEARLEQAARESERRRTLVASRLIANELKEQAEQAEITARAAAEQARLLAASLAPGEAEERVLTERLAAARAALARTQIRATVAGTVLTRNAEPGDVVQPGRVLLEIARQGATELSVPVDEKNLSLLALGQPAIAIADAYPDRPFAARVSFIAPAVDPARGTVEIRLAVDPVPEFLRQDMTVSVSVETGRRDRALVVPNDALVGSNGDRATVRVVEGGRVRDAEVRLGLRGAVLSEVTAGLAEGDWVLQGTADAPGPRVRVVAEALPDAGSDTGSRRELPVRLD